MNCIFRFFVINLLWMNMYYFYFNKNFKINKSDKLTFIFIDDSLIFFESSLILYFQTVIILFGVYFNEEINPTMIK